MAEQKIYIGSVGPMLYEDTDLLDDPDGDLSGATKQGITTTGGAYFGNGVVTASIDLLDTNASNTLSLIWNENDTVDRTLNLLVSGANRSLTLSGDSEIDQDLATTSTPTFVDLILSSPTYTMFNLSDPGVTQVPQWNYGISSWEWVSAGVTDLSAFTTDDLTEGVSNLYFPGFTDLSTDYGFTDNSSNWNTAYGWGDHTSAGYLTAASTGVTGDWTINSDLGDVTSKLTFGRTTGGNAEISYNGTNIGLNKYTAVTVANGQVAMRLIGDAGRLRIYPYDSATYGTLLQAMQTDEGSFPYYIPMTFGANPFIFYYGQVLINTESAIGTEKLRVNGNQYLDGELQVSSTGKIISGSKALTDGSAVGIFEVAIPSNTSAGGTVSFSVKVFDGTDLQNETGFFSFNGVNKAGTVTSDINRIRSDVDGADTRTITGGTLNLTLSTTNGAGKITVNLNANTSLTPTSFIVNYTIMLNGNEVVTKL